MNTNQQKIIPSLWFDTECEEAMNFYVSAFSGISGENQSRIISVQRYEEGLETPGIEEMVGKVLTGIFELEGYRFIALDGGPIFKFNPSASFMVNFDPSRIEDAAKKEVQLWEKLSEGGKVLMELDEYPYSKLYGWIEDKYGLSWQLILSDPEGEPRPFIIPSLLFTGDVAGKAEEAIQFYTSVFNNSGIGTLERYPSGMEPDKEGTAMYSDFRIENQWFAAMDSARTHGMSFNESISFTVNCRGQEEVDRLWESLSYVPEAEQCGWLKDRYGVSWQIVPERLNELMSDSDKDKVRRVINTLLKMKKLEVRELEEAYVES
jgi:predicted 3-demethylubiquinone-9 3-methyltransferase (glyoxalase superfamily)